MHDVVPRFPESESSTLTGGLKLTVPRRNMPAAQAEKRLRKARSDGRSGRESTAQLLQSEKLPAMLWH